MATHTSNLLRENIIHNTTVDLATPTLLVARQRNKAMEKKWKGRVRSASEPALRLQCGGVTRERRRESQVEYETGRDHAALSVSRWSADEVRPSIIRSISRSLSAGVCGALPCSVSM